jgi:hypothetical protein
MRRVLHLPLALLRLLVDVLSFLLALGRLIVVWRKAIREDWLLYTLALWFRIRADREARVSPAK